MRKTSIAAAAILLMAPCAQGQQAERLGVEVRPFVGAYVPFATFRRDFKDATTLGVQGAYEWGSYVHLVSTFAWTHGHNKFVGLSKDNTSILHYDVGGELNAIVNVSDSWMLRPFAGLGGGARSYDYGAAGVVTRSCTTGYGSLGTELQSGLIALRLEARHYLACFESPITGTKKTRQDGLFSLGLAYHFR